MSRYIIQSITKYLLQNYYGKPNLFVVPCAEGSLTQCGAIFSNGDICKHVTDSKVLDTYIERLQYFQRVTLVADYTEQLIQNLEEVKQQATTSGVEIDRKKKLLQLQQLAENIRLYCPDARQCANCGWGPILLDSKCDRLSDHHLQKLSGGGVYDNSCRQCGVRAELKSSLPLWDGKLPQSLTAEEGLGDQTVVAAAPAAPLNRLAELVKDLELTIDDFEFPSFRSAVKGVFSQNDRYDVETVNELRVLITGERQRVLEIATNIPPLSLRVLRHAHPILPSHSARRYTAECDICEGRSAYFCGSCDWDICIRCLNNNPPVNRSNCSMTRGTDNVYYCGRRLGTQVIPGSDGQCGPNNGPQCPDCSGFRLTSDVPSNRMPDRINRRMPDVDMSRMVMRMFHPVNGRLNFAEMGVIVSDSPESAEATSCFSPLDLIHSNCAVPVLAANFTKPPPDVMAAMLAREQKLRLSPETQALYADLSVDSIAITSDLQVQVVREFGFPDSYVQLLRGAANLYTREELAFDKLPHYVRFNRSTRGHLSVGSSVPNVPLCFVGQSMQKSLLLREMDAARTTVIAAGSFT